MRSAARPSASERDIARRARRLGNQQGDAIQPHRSIWHLEPPLARLGSGLALAAALTAALLAVRPLLAAAWADVLVGWMQALALTGRFDAVPHGDEGALGLGVPLIDLRPRPQHDLAPFGHGAAAMAVWWLAGRLPDAARPGAYLLRFAALIHAASVIFFSLRGASFPHSLLDYPTEGLRQAWALMLVVPWLHLATYYLFPFALWRCAALSVLTLAWMALLAPLQYALHAALLHGFGPIVMPLLHLLFGVTVPVVGFVALYGWAMSWPDAMRVGEETRPAGARD